MHFDGSLVVVSHDRAFLDNVVTSTLVFTGDGRVEEFVGGYEDWQRHCAAATAPVRTAKPKEKPRHGERARRLTFKETKELEGLPAEIETLEEEKAGLEARMADPAFYKGEGSAIAAATARLQELGERLEAAYARWEELEAVAEQAG